jgi:putative MATE family efflux protein
MNAPPRQRTPEGGHDAPGGFRLATDRTVGLVVLGLAWPVLVQRLLVVAVTFSDRLLVGYTHRPAAQAAQTTAVYLAWFLTCYAVLVNVGGTTLTAHLVGAGEWRTARAVMHQALLLAALLGVVGGAVGLAVLGPLLGLLQLHGEAAALAVVYLRPLLIVLGLQMVGLAGLACLSGAGDTRTGMCVLGGVAVLNVPLACVLFRGAFGWPGLGFAGIAVGTAVAQGLGGLAVLGVLIHGRAGLRLEWALLWPRPDLLRRLLRVSLPAGLDYLSMQVGYLWFLAIVNGLGDVAAAAHGVALVWESLAYQPGSAFGTAAVAVVGQSLGARRPDRAARAGWVAFALAVGVMSVAGVLFYSLAPAMVRLFCPSAAQAGIVARGVPVLRLVAFGMPALASCLVLAEALRGAGDTRFPMLFTWVGFFAVRIPLAYLLTYDRVSLGPWGEVPGVGWGLWGAWLAMICDLQVRGLFLLARFAGGRWRGIRV